MSLFKRQRFLCQILILSLVFQSLVFSSGYAKVPKAINKAGQKIIKYSAGVIDELTGKVDNIGEKLNDTTKRIGKQTIDRAKTSAEAKLKNEANERAKKAAEQANEKYQTVVNNLMLMEKGVETLVNWMKSPTSAAAKVIDVIGFASNFGEIRNNFLNEFLTEASKMSVRAMIIGSSFQAIALLCALIPGMQPVAAVCETLAASMFATSKLIDAAILTTKGLIEIGIIADDLYKKAVERRVAAQDSIWEMNKCLMPKPRGYDERNSSKEQIGFTGKSEEEITQEWENNSSANQEDEVDLVEEPCVPSHSVEPIE